MAVIMTLIFYYFICEGALQREIPWFFSSADLKKQMIIGSSDLLLSPLDS